MNDVTLDIRAGEILCLLGENGAGKTTVMNIAAGALRPDEGAIALGDATFDHLTPEQARDGGIAMVHQHFVLVPAFTAAENLALSAGDSPALLSSHEIVRIAREMVEASGLSFARLTTLVSDLSVGEKSRLELIRVLARRPRVLILDEPTSVLAPMEVAELIEVMRQLARNGTAIVFITHKLAEVFDAADRIVVMRRGKVIREVKPSEVTAHELAGEIVELSAESRQEIASARGDEVLKLDSVSTMQRGHATALDRVSLSLAAGEITAIVGVAGNGQGELAAVLRGLTPATNGMITIAGREMSRRDLQSAADVGHIPMDRSEAGFVGELTIAENLVIASAAREFLRRRMNAQEQISRFRIRAQSEEQKVGSLSGGNQQKVILARELSRRPRLLVAAEPTRGLDVEATRSVHEQLRAAARDGTAILLITSDLDEATLLASSIRVMYRGKLSAPLSATTPIEVIGRAMVGLQ